MSHNVRAILKPVSWYGVPDDENRMMSVLGTVQGSGDVRLHIGAQ